MYKEKLSALMDGELIDNELISDLSRNPELQQDWFRYHLIRDTLRGDSSSVINFDIAERVAAVIAQEPVQLIPEAQPIPATWQKMPFWHKVRPLLGYIGQAGVAAGVSLAVIVGVQNYSQDPNPTAQPDILPLSTFSIGNMASPVSYGISDVNDQQNMSGELVQEQRKRITILQDYELQRRINTESLNPQLSNTQAIAK